MHSAILFFVSYYNPCSDTEDQKGESFIMLDTIIIIQPTRALYVYPIFVVLVIINYILEIVFLIPFASEIFVIHPRMLTFKGQNYV